MSISDPTQSDSDRFADESGLGAIDQTSLKRLDRAPLSADIRVLSIRSPCRWLTAVGIQWVVISGAAAVIIIGNSWYLYPVVVVVIASRQHALGVCMHEAAHYLAFSNRKLNDFASNIFCAYPLGLGTSTYRHYHFKHHRNVNTSEDPDVQIVEGDSNWAWPKSRLQSGLVLLCDLLGINALSYLRNIMRWSPLPLMFSSRSRSTHNGNAAELPSRERLLFAAWLLVGVAGLLIIPDAWKWYLLLWLVPQVTVLALIFRIRGLAEHTCVQRDDELTQTRTVLASWFERCLIAPCNINYHLEHHLFPSVPYFNLPKVHRLLSSSELFRTRAKLTTRYLVGRHSLFSELIRQPLPSDYCSNNDDNATHSDNEGTARA